jgi:hypothetical protein
VNSARTGSRTPTNLHDRRAVNTVESGCVLRGCDGPAGDSPARVMVKQACSMWPAEGKTQPSKSHDKGSMGVEQVIGPYDEESRRVDRPTPGNADQVGAQPGSTGEGHGRCKELDVQHPGTHRRMRSGTITQPIAEQERSVSAPAFTAAGCHPAVPRRGEAYKRRGRGAVNWWSAERKSEEAIR